MIKHLLFPPYLMAGDGETTGGSPAATDANAATSSNAESTTGSTTSDESGKAEASTTQKGPSLAETVGKIVADANKEGEAESSTAKEEAEKESISQGEKDSESESTEEGSEKTDTTEEDQGPVPYDRFREVNEAKTTLEAKVKEFEPIVEAQKGIAQFCETNGITPEQFTQGMELLALVNSNPVEARKRLEPIWNQLSGLSGDSLPEDLAKKVDDGVIDEETARELARLRGHTKVSESQRKLNEQRSAEAVRQAQIKSISDSVTQWGSAKQKTDPDFKPKSGPNAPDGKYEVFADRLYRLMASSFPQNVSDAINLAEQAYKDATAMFGRFAKRPVSSPRLNSSKSSSTSNSQPKTAMDAVNAVLRQKHGISVG